MTDKEFKGRVLVLGGHGMLGRQVAITCRNEGYQVWAPGSNADITDPCAMHKLESEIRPHYVVNCAGIIPQRMGLRIDADMVRVNAFGPWVVRAAFSRAKIVHVSTDCVFKGDSFTAYCAEDQPDAISTYGRSKAMGEIPHTVVVRTSFIGMEHGLLPWVLGHRDGAQIPGWTNAHWNGGTVMDVAEGLVKMLDATLGTYHMGTLTCMSKYQLIQAIAAAFGRKFEVVPHFEPRINRVLDVDVPIELRLDRLVEAATHAS